MWNNEGGVAFLSAAPRHLSRSCAPRFCETYSDELLESYLDDVSTASATGRSLMTEKYAG